MALRTWKKRIEAAMNEETRKKKEKKIKTYKNDKIPEIDSQQTSSKKIFETESAIKEKVKCDDTKNKVFKKIYNCRPRNSKNEAGSLKSIFKFERFSPEKTESQKHSEEDKKIKNKKRNQESVTDTQNYEKFAKKRKIKTSVDIGERENLLKDRPKSKVEEKKDENQQTQNNNEGFEDIPINWQRQNGSSVPSPTESRSNDGETVDEIHDYIKLTNPTSIASSTTVSCDHKTEEIPKEKEQNTEEQSRNQNEIPSKDPRNEKNRAVISGEKYLSYDLTEKTKKEKALKECLSKIKQNGNKSKELEMKKSPVRDVPITQTEWYPKAPRKNYYEGNQTCPHDDATYWTYYDDQGTQRQVFGNYNPGLPNYAFNPHYLEPPHYPPGDWCNNLQCQPLFSGNYYQGNNFNTQFANAGMNSFDIPPPPPPPNNENFNPGSWNLTNSTSAPRDNNADCSNRPRNAGQITGNINQGLRNRTNSTSAPYDNNADRSSRPRDPGYFAGNHNEGLQNSTTNTSGPCYNNTDRSNRPRNAGQFAGNINQGNNNYSARVATAEAGSFNPPPSAASNRTNICGSFNPGNYFGAQASTAGSETFKTLPTPATNQTNICRSFNPSNNYGARVPEPDNFNQPISWGPNSTHINKSFNQDRTSAPRGNNSDPSSSLYNAGQSARNIIEGVNYSARVATAEAGSFNTPPSVAMNPVCESFNPGNNFSGRVAASGPANLNMLSLPASNEIQIDPSFNPGNNYGARVPDPDSFNLPLAPNPTYNESRNPDSTSAPCGNNADPSSSLCNAGQFAGNTIQGMNYSAQVAAAEAGSFNMPPPTHINGRFNPGNNFGAQVATTTLDTFKKPTPATNPTHHGNFNPGENCSVVNTAAATIYIVPHAPAPNSTNTNENFNQGLRNFTRSTSALCDNNANHSTNSSNAGQFAGNNMTGNNFGAQVANVEPAANFITPPTPATNPTLFNGSFNPGNNYGAPVATARSGTFNLPPPPAQNSTRVNESFNPNSTSAPNNNNAGRLNSQWNAGQFAGNIIQGYNYSTRVATVDAGSSNMPPLAANNPTYISESRNPGSRSEAPSVRDIEAMRRMFNTPWHPEPYLGTVEEAHSLGQ